MKSFTELKKNRKQRFDNVASKSKEVLRGGFEEDDRFWKPTMDKSGNAQAIVRFLPAPPGEDLEWAMVWSHFFQGPGGWYVEKSLTTIGQDDPVSEHNSMLWNSGSEAKKDTARKQKRRRDYYSNVYVVKDPGNPDNEGQVKIYRYGTTVFNKINDKMNPQFEGDERINPFDLWEGANFKLRIYRADGFPKYDKCEFMSSGPLFDDDDRLEEVWRRCHPLRPFATEDFKPYDELKKKLNRVLGLGQPGVKPRQSDETSEPETKEPIVTREEIEVTPVMDNESDDMAFFNSLRA